MRKIDVRVICATNRNPLQMITERKFREDLFYRLHVLPIHLPPLRQRPTDIMVLARHFLARYAREEHKVFGGFSNEASQQLTAADWPGNIRQLQNLVRRIVVMFDGGDIDIGMLTAADIESRGLCPGRGPAPRAEGRRAILSMWRQEQKIIEDAITGLRRQYLPRAPPRSKSARPPSIASARAGRRCLKAGWPASKTSPPHNVIPAKAGYRVSAQYWIPAFATIEQRSTHPFQPSGGSCAGLQHQTPARKTWHWPRRTMVACRRGGIIDVEELVHEPRSPVGGKQQGKQVALFGGMSSLVSLLRLKASRPDLVRWRMRTADTQVAVPA